MSGYRNSRRPKTMAEFNNEFKRAALPAGFTRQLGWDLPSDEIVEAWLAKLNALSEAKAMKSCHHLGLHKPGDVPAFIYMACPEKAMCGLCIYPWASQNADPNRCDGCGEDSSNGLWREFTVTTNYAMLMGHLCSECSKLLPPG